jgi:hypothetical protein
MIIKMFEFLNEPLTSAKLTERFEISIASNNAIQRIITMVVAAILNPGEFVPK